MPWRTAKLARSITRASSKQTYLITRLLVDRDLQDDCFRAYAYLRWVDDVIDGPSCAREERVAFIRRQEKLVHELYSNHWVGELCMEEGMVADLIARNPERDSGLFSFIHNFLAILKFDAHRRGERITQGALDWYSYTLSKAVTDGIQFFIGNGHSYPRTAYQYSAVIAAHIIHMLRDMLDDIPAGFINIPLEALPGEGAEDLCSPNVPSPAWVQARVNLARDRIREGKRYLESLDGLRCKLAGYWYCARYEGTIVALERDAYALRRTYPRGLATWLRMTWLGFAVTARHLAHRQIEALRRSRGALMRPREVQGERAVEDVPLSLEGT